MVHGPEEQCEDDTMPASRSRTPDHLARRTSKYRFHLRDAARRHQRVAYAALFEASSEALSNLAANPKFVGTDRLGFFGVLHTWGRTLEYHPRVHYVVPGGGIDEIGGRWLLSRADFLVPVEALSFLFRAKFRDILAREPASPRLTTRLEQ